jgi:hypothetical protein
MSKEKITLALEALKDATLHIWLGDKKGVEANVRAHKNIKALEEALASEQEQRSDSEQLGEPVAWISHNAGLYHFKPDESLDPMPLYTTQQPKQEQGEPYAIEAGFDNGDGTYSVRIERYKKDLKTHKDWKSLEKLLYTTPQPAQKPLTDWVGVEDRLPEAGGYYLVTVATDDGPHVDVLLFDAKRKHWEHEGEPTFCHSYYFEPTHWAMRPEDAHGIKENT